ncbi:MAG: hypothetical protein CL840_12020 [Crocinitomicaceae bacterium]|nr:hypothetical protein [Crocinitomicaceae bacterium]
MGFIRTILILGLIYFGARIVMRVIFPWILKTFVRKVERKMKDQMNQQGAGHSGFEKANEDVYIKRPQEKQGKSTKDFDGGEYIDFEEVDKD